jgi:hypothetical protein
MGQLVLYCFIFESFKLLYLKLTIGQNMINLKPHLIVAVSLFSIFISEKVQAMCPEPDVAGTAILPPSCVYRNDPALMPKFNIIDGLPPGTTIEINAVIDTHSNQTVLPGGGLGGEIETFDSLMHLTMTGTGALAGFNRNIVMPISSVTFSAPRTPGDPVQIFTRDYNSLNGSIFGDPDFDQFTLFAGMPFALPPSPGSTTIVDIGGGIRDVATFFDLFYQIDFTGAPGSVLAGLAGSTQGIVRIGTPSAVMPVELMNFEIE